MTSAGRASSWTSLMEKRRKFLHVSFGLLVIAVLLAAEAAFGADGRVYVECVLSLALFGGMVAVHRRLSGKRTPFDFLFRLLERPGAPPGYGAFWYGLGLLLAFSFLTSANEIAACILILAVGDGAASIIGSSGKVRLPHNRAKTLEGIAAFFLFSLLSFFFIGPRALPLAVIASAVESMNLHLDDNFTIPLSCVAFFKLAG